MIPWCFNRSPRTGQWVRAGYRRGKILLRWLPYRMSQGCMAWDTGDGATPAPVLNRWLCHGCKWLPKEAEPWLWMCFSRELKPFVEDK